MIVQYYLIDVPYLGVIGDLISRDGEPGEDNYPFPGIQQRINSKCRNTAPALCFQLLKDPKKEYDFTHKKKGMEFMPMYTRIDDVPEEVIYSYIEQVLYAICNYNREGYRAFQTYNSREQYTYQDGEDDSVTSESEMLMDGAGTYSYEEIIAWKRKLPYLVKRLHDKSLQTGFHVISAVIAKQKCIKARELDTDGRKRAIMPKELIANTIFTISSNGTINGVVTENVADFQQDFCQWIRGDERFRDSYYDDMQELYKICSKLGIKLEYENPINYTGTFINSLVSDYIIENSKLSLNVALQQSNGGLPVSVRNVISRLSLDDLDQIPQILQEAKGRQSQPTLTECTENTLMMFFNSELCCKVESSFISKQQLSDLCMQYCIYFGSSIMLKTLAFNSENGFLIKSTTSEYFSLNVLQFVTENQGMGTEALIHKSGIIVLLNVRKLNKSLAWTTVDGLTAHLKQSNTLKLQGKPPIPYKWSEIDDL